MTIAACSTDAKELDARDRLTTRSLRDDEIRAIADAIYRSDNPLRFEGVRQAALLFERAGYTITRDLQVSALAVTRQPITVGSLTVDPMRRTVQLDGRDIEMKSREFDLIDLREELFRLIDIDSRAIEAAALLREWCGSSPIGFSSGKSPRCSAIYASLAKRAFNLSERGSGIERTRWGVVCWRKCLVWSSGNPIPYVPSELSSALSFQCFQACFAGNSARVGPLL
jgi:hypothetical protein